MLIYHYNKKGEYIGEATADKNPLEKGKYLIPAYATDKKPPVPSENEVAVFENNDWIIKQDFRGRTGCEIDLNGYFVKIHEFIIGEIPTDNILLINPPSEDMYKPKFDGLKWVQGEGSPPAQPPTLEELTGKINEVKIENEQINLQMIDLFEQLLDKGVL